MDENLQVQQEFAARGLNHQQSRLLEQEGTHEQKAKEMATLDTEEIQATSIHFFSYYSCIHWTVLGIDYSCCG